MNPFSLISKTVNTGEQVRLTFERYHLVLYYNIMLKFGVLKISPNELIHTKIFNFRIMKNLITIT